MRPFFDDRFKVERFMCDIYLFKGPGTYIPRKEEAIIDLVESTIVKPDTGILFEALYDMVDMSGTERKAGSLWVHT